MRFTSAAAISCRGDVSLFFPSAELKIGLDCRSVPRSGSILYVQEVFHGMIPADSLLCYCRKPYAKDCNMQSLLLEKKSLPCRFWMELSLGKTSRFIHSL